MNRLFLATMMTLVLGQFASAADISVDPGDIGLALIRVVGNIVPSDGDKFRDLAAGHDHAFVVLNSHGGSVLAALEAGDDENLWG